MQSTRAPQTSVLINELCVRMYEDSKTPQQPTETVESNIGDFSVPLHLAACNLVETVSAMIPRVDPK